MPPCLQAVMVTCSARPARASGFPHNPLGIRERVGPCCTALTEGGDDRDCDLGKVGQQRLRVRGRIARLPTSKRVPDDLTGLVMNDPDVVGPLGWPVIGPAQMASQDVLRALQPLEADQRHDRQMRMAKVANGCTQGKGFGAGRVLDGGGGAEPRQADERVRWHELMGMGALHHRPCLLGNVDGSGWRGAAWCPPCRRGGPRRSCRRRPA